MKSIILAVVCLLLAACGSDEQVVDETTAAADSEFTGSTGQVLSVIPVQSYTYIEVRNNGRSLWLAGSSIDVSEGDVISWTDSTVMQDFYSKTLDRTFDEIVFVSAIDTGTGGETAAAQAAPAVDSGTVRSTEDASGYTYVELETESGQVVWLAAPKTEIAVGDQVAWMGGATMVDFTSTTLNKTFPEILFVQKISVTE